MLLVEVTLVVVGEQGGHLEQMEYDADMPPQDGQVGIQTFRLRPRDVRVVLRLEVVELEFEAPQPFFAERGESAQGAFLRPGPVAGPDVLTLGGEVQEGRCQQGDHLRDRLGRTCLAIMGQQTLRERLVI